MPQPDMLLQPILTATICQIHLPFDLLLSCNNLDPVIKYSCKYSSQQKILSLGLEIKVQEECNYIAGRSSSRGADRNRTEPLERLKAEHQRLQTKIPCTVGLLTTSVMLLTLLVQPSALPQPSEEPIQVVEFGESGPVCCSRCKGYINPMMKFIGQGRRFICNFCGFTDETACDYHCNLDPDGRSRDADERPELCRGKVEFVATKEYMARDPMPAECFFLIDVPTNAIQTGVTAAACSSINQVIGDLPEGHRTMVGIATLDSRIHFYNLKCALQQPLMLIVPDVKDVYTPLQTDVIIPLLECRQHLELPLESIPPMFQSSRTAESAFGPAIKAAFMAMKSTGRTLLVFQSVLPSVGIGALSAREAVGRSNVSAGQKAKEEQKILFLIKLQFRHNDHGL